MPDVVTATILNITQGQEMKPEYELMSIDISKEVNKIPTAQLILLDGDAAQQKFVLSNAEFFQPGEMLEIRLRYEDESANPTVFVGIVVKHNIQASAQTSLLTLYLKDAAIKLTHPPKNAVFRDSSDATIFKKIINQVGNLKIGTIAPTPMVHPEMVQFYCTDWDFIVSRAEANGCWVMVNDSQITIQSPDFITTTSLRLEYGIDQIYELDMEVDIRDQYKAVEAIAWDSQSQTLMKPQAGKPTTLPQGNLKPEPLASAIGADNCQLISGAELAPQEMQAWVEAKLSKSRWSMLRGRLCIPGVATVKLGGVLELKGIGDRFNGKTLITGVRHQVNESGWQTDIQFGLSATWFAESQGIIDPPANGLVPAVNGLQIGVVDQYVEDPDKKLRVKVKIPRLITSSTSDGIVWARLAVLDAGLTADGNQGRGTFFRPEPGDEVILGFLNDDPRQAVILGALYSEKQAPPWKVSADNPEKGIVTKENLKLYFDDKNKVIILETPGKNKITIMDTKGIEILDENKNQFNLTSKGIKIMSDKDIEITAKGNITLQGTKVDVK